MADKTTSSLTAATTPLAGNELLYLIQSANSRRVAASEIVKISHQQAWSTITSTPTTLSGYGITDAQPLDSDLTAIAALDKTDGNFIVADGTAWTVESGAAARASLGLGSAATTDATAYATAAQGATADSALQPGDIGVTVQGYDALLSSVSSLAIVAGDLVYGSAANTVARLPIGTSGQVLKVGDTGVPEWGAVAGTGDMLASVYDPTAKAADAFSMSNMVEGTDAKIMTAAERANIAGAAQKSANLSDLADASAALNNLGINVDGTVQAAEAAADRAEAAAAGVNLPSIVAGDAGKVLFVKDDESGYGLAIPPDAISVARYGADPTAAAAVNQQAFVDAIAAAPLGGVVIIPDGWSLTVDQIVINKSLSLVARGASLIRSPTSAFNSFINITGDKVRISGIVFDGNKTLNPNPCNLVQVANGTTFDFELTGCTLTNAKASGGYGDGLYVDMASNDNSRVYISSNKFISNDANGCEILDASDAYVGSNIAEYNGLSGIICNNYDQTFQKKIVYTVITGNEARGNSRNGIAVGNIVANNDFTSPVYGYDNFEALYCSITSNIVSTNDGYGLVADGQGLLVDGNLAFSNGVDTGGNGGMLCNIYQSVVSNNIVRSSAYWGIDAGASQLSLFTGNHISFSGASLGTSAPLNVGGGIGNHVIGNYLYENANANITVIAHEGDGAGGYFPNESNQTVIRGNYIQMKSGAVGVSVRDGVAEITIVGNDFRPVDTDLSYCIRCLAKRASVYGNTVQHDKSTTVTIDGGGFLTIPDVLDSCEVVSGGTINGIRTSSMAYVGSGIPWCTVTAGGSGFTSAPTVTITGDGTGATAHALVREGAVLGIVMDNYGSGYSSASVAFSGGGGTGASATAQIGVPLQARVEKHIYFNAACTVVKSGTPPLAYPATGDLSVPVFGSLTLRAFSGGWRVKSQVIA